jgi:hypothetical protein
MTPCRGKIKAIQTGEWMDEKDWREGDGSLATVEYGRGEWETKRYRLGWHIYTSLKSARISGNYGANVYRVKYRGVRQTGEEEHSLGKSLRVVVAREMYVYPKEVK